MLRAFDDSEILPELSFPPHSNLKIKLITILQMITEKQNVSCPEWDLSKVM